MKATSGLNVSARCRAAGASCATRSRVPCSRAHRPASRRRPGCRPRPGCGARRTAVARLPRWPRPASIRRARPSTAPSAAGRRTRCRARGHRCARPPTRRCRSTRLRTIVSPRPSPPCARSIACGSWTNRSKMRGEHVGCDAHAGVPHAQHDVTQLLVGSHRDRSARRGVLRGVGQEVRRDLRQPRGIACAPPGPRRGTCNRQRVRPLFEQRAGHLDGFRHDVRHLDDLLLQLHLASRDARHVQQVVDEPREVSHLALDDRPLAFGGVVAAEPHQLERGEDGRERIAELMAQHREEFVFRAVGPFGGASQLIQLVPRKHLISHVGGHDENALDVALDVPERRVDEIEIQRLERSAAAIEGCWCLLADVCDPRAIDLIEQRSKHAGRESPAWHRAAAG